MRKLSSFLSSSFKIVPFKTRILIFVALHTALVVLIGFAVFSAESAAGIYLVPFGILVVLVSVFFAFRSVVNCVNEEIVFHAMGLEKMASDLENAVAVMDSYRLELECRANAIDSCGRELDRRVEMINLYSDRLGELAAVIGQPELASDKKAG